MKVELRERTLQSGNRTLYLEFYEKGGKRTYETLNLFLIPEKTKEDRRQNENTLKHALKLKSERILGIERDPEQPEEHLPRRVFTDFLDSYIEHCKNDLHLRNIKRIENVVRIVRAYLDHVKHPRMLLEKFDTKVCKDFNVYLKDTYKNTHKKGEPLSDNTRFMIQSTMSTMLNWAVHEGLIHNNPYLYMKGEDKFAKVEPDVEYLTVDEVKALADVYTGSPQTKQAFLFCCFTGLRHSDLKRFKWCHIEKTDIGDVIHIPSMQKTGKPVRVPLGQQARLWMPEWTEGTNPDTPVFPNIPSIGTADRALKHMAKRAGIEKNIHFHMSRHTFATLNLTAGSDLYTTSKLLGHQSIESTQIYADVVMDIKITAVNLTAGLFSMPKKRNRRSK